ncbi:MAG TPA: xylulokinase [Candidatus Acidoferrales bacterium]|nr:xylulokinase [Candidatus Acidoferrales bacterium]
MYIGIDLGTSSLKAVLVDEAQREIDQASSPLTVQRPQRLWSEQNPEDWWQALGAVMAGLKARHPAELAAVRSIGLAGQMHGAVLLDESDRVLRPAILWNDGRSAAQCEELERRAACRRITGNLAMPGFTAPKLLWVAEHEPEIFPQVRHVLLPKDYLRLRLTGDRVSEMSDAAGTLWLDVARRTWSLEMLAATQLTKASMPRLVEGSQPSAMVRDDLAHEWGMRNEVCVAGGAGDNAAGAVGIGVVRHGQAFVSLGTSGVYFVANDSFRPNPESAVHTFCHCLPQTWHQMSVILSAASCVSWVTTLTGATSEAVLLDEVDFDRRDSGVIFLPYLSGERTPHNDPHAQGVFFGMGHDTTRGDLARAVLEGVAFAFADGQQALLDSGTKIDEVSVIGGGARSPLWGRILASVLDRPLRYYRGGEIGPAAGAARLARLAVTGEDPHDVCVPPPLDHVAEPEARLRDRYTEASAVYRRLYQELKDIFPRAPSVS